MIARQMNEVIGMASPGERQSLMQLLQRLRNPNPGWPQVPEGFRGNIPALKGERILPSGLPALRRINA